MLAFFLTIAGLCVLCFYAGATLSWALAKGSLDVVVPPWIPAIGLVAATLFVAAWALDGNWVMALSTSALLLLMIGVQLRQWRRPSGGGETP